jgi:hypothetical protein
MRFVIDKVLGGGLIEISDLGYEKLRVLGDCWEIVLTLSISHLISHIPHLSLNNKSPFLKRAFEVFFNLFGLLNVFQ